MWPRKKSPPLSLFPSFIQKAKNAWVAQSDLWAPQRFNFSQPLTKYYIIQSLTSPSHLEGPAWSSKNFLHATASAASPSNEWGSKNCIFSSNLSAWFRIASILALFRCTCSSKSWILMAACAISFFRISSSRALIHWTLASSSYCLVCNIPTIVSWSGNSCSLCSASTWQRL